MVIITTIGRSGSSFLTKWLSECGLDVGSEQWFKPFNAGMENKKASIINAMLVQSLIKKEKINIYDAWSGIHTLRSDIVKDPQFLMHPEIIENWWHVRKDLKIVYLDRDFKKIAESQKKIPQWTAPVYRCFPELMKVQEFEFLDMVDDLQIPIKRFTYPDFLTQIDFLIESLSEWIELPENAKDKFLELRDNNEH